MCHGVQWWLPVYCCWVRIWARAREGARGWLVDSLLRRPAPASPHRSARCCRNDCSHGLGCLRPRSNGVMCFSCCWRSFLVCSSLSFCVGTAAGEEGWGHGSPDRRLFGWVWINWARPSCWTRANFCYQSLGKEGWPMTGTANVLGLIGGGGQSKARWAVGVVP